ncbi:MAG: type III pantothenate kinase [Phycisphaerales bacterium]
MAFLLAISVGNTRTAVGHFHGDDLHGTQHLDNTSLEAIVAAAEDQWKHATDTEADDTDVVIASVNDPVADRLEAMVAERLSTSVWRIGRDLEIPVGRQLDANAKPGQDRLLAAAAAFDMLKQAVIVVDAGTCVTVDFVDGHGTFHGGAIAPGARMQLRAMHQGTAALPDISWSAPEHDETFGRNTKQAMLLGVYEGIRGGVQRLAERYSESYGAFPHVLATGGDAEMLFQDDPVVTRVVPELVLRGIWLAVRHERNAAAE